MTFKKHILVMVVGAVLLALAGCSTQKNTWFTRFVHTTTTQYNVHFNGKLSYEAGMEKIMENNVDNYAKVLPMYPISNAENAQVATSDMNRTIEKCRKSIKLHSIQKKPQKNYKKMRNPKYMAFYNQVEFNAVMDEVWLLLAQAEFHKGDFLGSVGTFMYISKHYKDDMDVVAQCQLWIMRAYAEMGWIYEAEDMLLKIQQDDLKRANSQLYAAFNADLLIKKKQYKEAIPFLKLAEANEKDKKMRMRFNFILGQLYEIQGDVNAAYDAYEKVMKGSPEFEMDFNAHVNSAQLMGDDSKSLRMLGKMAKQYKFKDNLDQLYGAMGNIYLERGDTLEAIRHYGKGVELSTKNGFEKADVLVTLGDLHYGRKEYAQAQPCYDEASQIILATDENYGRVSKLAEVLNELVVHQEIVTLQDSLLHLSTLSEAEQLAVAKQIIADLEEAERLEAEEAERKKREGEDEGLQGINTQNMLGGGGSGKWYFYNVNLMRSGKTEFAKTWGRRKLEDNWRRGSKTMNTTFGDAPTEDTAVAEGDSVAGITATKVNDVKSPEYYLQQIPRTQQQMAFAHGEVATALYNMGYVYKDRIEDLALAQETFDELERRYPQDERMVDAYYVRHMMALQQDEALEAERYRTELIRKFPDTKQAQMLEYPDYAKRLEQMGAKQDSVYEATYEAYLGSRFDVVFENKKFVEANYPLSPLMPKFYFLNALSVGKTQSPELFGDALREMVAKYPDSDVSAMAKDMLALMNQGLESQKGATHGSLIAKREEEVKREQQEAVGAANEFSPDKQAPSVCLFLLDGEDDEAMNELLYRVAFFNFSKFLIKEYDLSIMPFGDGQSILKVSNFAKYDEVEWYEQLVRKDVELNMLLNKMGVELVVITEENLKLLYGLFTLTDYKLFQEQL